MYDGDLFVDNAYYGTPGCIIFDPNGLSESAGDVYTVTVDGIPQPLQYEVRFWGIDSVYRLFNPWETGPGAHHYTTSADERDTLVRQGWRDEGIYWYGLR